MRKGKIYIGTSGWSYKHWKDIYYPSDLKTTDYLSFYAKDFSVSEINSSFYHLPREQTVINWVAKVPHGFKFCPKMSRYITHMKKLNDVQEALERFFLVFEPMRTRCGPVLVQLPPSLKFNEEVVADFFKLLKSDYSQYAFALEVRHASWLEANPLSLLRKYKIAFVISQSKNRFPYAEEVTSKHIYLRFHGPEALYASGYTSEMLQQYAKKIRAWSNDGHIIWAFFNNDIAAHALTDAKVLEEMVK